jgi:Flavodoxin domain
MNVLVAYGSKRGGTSGIAAQLADKLRGAGFTVDLRDASKARHVASYDAVMAGRRAGAQRRRLVKLRDDFLRPGLDLSTVAPVAGEPLRQQALRVGHQPATRAEVGSFAAGAALVLWITVQMLLLRSAHWLQLFYLALGLVMCAMALSLRHLQHRFSVHAPRAAAAKRRR